MATSALYDSDLVTDAALNASTRRPGHAGGPRQEGADQGWFHVPTSIIHLRQLLQAQSRIESRIVILQWVVMVIVGAGALLPNSLGPGLGEFSGSLVICVLVLHPIAYIVIATIGFPWLWRDGPARVAVLTAIDVAIAVGVLFLTASKPGYTQVLLFSVVLLTATRYSLSRAVGITTLVSILQFFSIVASNHNAIPVTNLSSAVVAMFALTYGVSLLSQAERKEAAIAAENARLYRAVLLRNRELATINALSQTATQDTDADRLLESGLELILSSMPVAWGQGYRYDRRFGDVDLLFVRHASKGTDRNERGAVTRAEAQEAARTRTVVIGTSAASGGEPLARVSAPILVQGNPVGVLQALVPLAHDESVGDPPSQSLTIVCQELGSWVEKAMLRDAAQHSLVLEEKNRIARELHDTVLQILFSLGLGVEWCMQRVDGDSSLSNKLGDMRRLTANASGELRSAIYTLSSRVAEVGLMSALETLTNSFTEQYELPASLSAVGQPPKIPLLTQNAMHRVVRESLMNAYKHARASHIAVRVVFDPYAVTVVVQDDGVGLPQQVIDRYAEDSAHFGLRTISRQIEELQGAFEIMNGEESGTVVRATIPVKRPAEEGYTYDHVNAH
jgi:signal transduction histidine kinase